MNNRRTIVSVWFWMLPGIMVLDSLLAQTKMSEISGLTEIGFVFLPSLNM
jgi:hypothetical protein